MLAVAEAAERDASTAVLPCERLSAPRRRAASSPADRRSVRFRGSDFLEMGLDHTLPFSLLPPSAAAVTPTWGLAYCALHVHGVCKKRAGSELAVFFLLPFPLM